MAYGSALVDAIQSSTAGVAPQFNDGNGTQIGTLCRAWVNFNGTTSPGTIRAAFNVGSVTKNGTGDYTLNFTNAMPDGNYSLVMTTNFGASNAFSTTAPSTTAARINSTNTTTGLSIDLSWIGVAIFR